MTTLEGRLAVVTGGSRGIGGAIAQRLADAGARHVVRLARTLEDRTGGRCTDLRCGVSREDDVARVTTRILAEQGAPDIVVNNAGAFLLKPVHETSAEEFRTQVDANLISAFLVMTALWDPMNPEDSADLPKRANMLHPEDVAEAVLFVVTRPAHVNVEWMRLASVK